jgi:hypothetical protein
VIAEQLDLFADTAGQPDRWYGVTVCWQCGQPVESYTLDDPGQPWQPAVLFGYVALKAHEREHHPERVS